MRPRVHSSKSAVSTSGSTAIRVRTSAAPTGFAVSTTIRRPGPTASATRPPDSFTTTIATAIKISPTASLFSRVRRSTKRVSRATRSSTAPPLPRTSTTRPVTATGFPTTIFTARRTSCRASVSPSSGREPIRSSFPTAATMPGSSFSSAAVLRRAVTIAAVRLSAGSWPPMLRDRSPTSKAGTALRLISDSGRGARCASSLSGLPEKSPFRKERAFWNIFCRFNTRISPPARRSGSDRAS